MPALATAPVIRALQPVDYLVFYVLPILGIVLLLFCIFSVIKGYKLPEAKQVFKGFGVNLEVSILSVFLIVSAVMLGVGIVVHIRAQDVDELRATISNLNRQIERSGRMSVRLVIAPPKDKPSWGELERLVCYYTLYSDGKETKAQVDAGPIPGSLQMIVTDIGRSDIIQTLQLRERGSPNVIATAENIYVLQPTVHLNAAAQ